MGHCWAQNFQTWEWPWQVVKQYCVFKLVYIPKQQSHIFYDIIWLYVIYDLWYDMISLVYTIIFCAYKWRKVVHTSHVWIKDVNFFYAFFRVLGLAAFVFWDNGILADFCVCFRIKGLAISTLHGEDCQSVFCIASSDGHIKIYGLNEIKVTAFHFKISQITIMSNHFCIKVGPFSLGMQAKFLRLCNFLQFIWKAPTAWLILHVFNCTNLKAGMWWTSMKT